MSEEAHLRAEASATSRIRAGWLVVMAAGSIGLLLAHYPMLVTGLVHIQGKEDSRLINYLLEHSYLWLKQEPLHRKFWDVPFFFPARRTAGFSDTLLTIAPVYWGWRALGIRPDTAFQSWMLTNSALNYLGGYWLLRSGFRRSRAGSVAGAFLFAFAAPRINEMEHQQLLPQVFMIATLMALIAIFRGPPNVAPWRAVALWTTAGLGLVAQFYTSFYLGWFLSLSLGVAMAWGLLLPFYRRHLVGVIRGQWRSIGFAAVVSTAALRPLMDLYLLTLNDVGVRDYWMVINPTIPDWRALIYMGSGSWAWGWMSRLQFMQGMGLEQAMRSGVGLVTPVACVVGLFLQRRSSDVRIIALALVGLLLVIVRIERPIVEGVALGFWASGAIGMWPGVGHPSDRPASAVMALMTAVTLYPGTALILPMFAIALMVAANQVSTDRARVRLAAAGGLIAIGFPLLTSHPYRPATLRVATGVAAFLVLAGLRAGPSRRSGLFFAVGTAVCAVLWLSWGEFNLCRQIIRVIPGGQALRAVSRGLLLWLVPASLGLACFFEFLERRGLRHRLVAAFALVVLLEQGVTSPSFDKLQHRAAVISLARKVDRRSRSFYYSPRVSRASVISAHLVAMWAEIETGIPTVNGYSGTVPPDWMPLQYANVDKPDSQEFLGQCLAFWASLNNLRPGDICWVRDEGSPSPSMAKTAIEDIPDELLEEWISGGS